MNKEDLLYSLCYVDLETTGVDPSRHEIIEVGALRVDYPRNFFEGGEPELVRELSIKVQFNGHIDPSASEVNHYSPDKWVDAVPLDSTLQALYPLIKESNLAGWNTQFDQKFLVRAWDNFGWSWPYGTGHRVVDVQSLARPFVARHFHKEQDLRKVNLEKVAKALNLIQENERHLVHTGLFDCHLAWRVNDCLSRRYYAGLVVTDHKPE